ncbi:MAG: TRAP transporter small permease [Ramlibacter sp.]|nr:TRAP transporter small permease [Ramlibacter sp.]MBX3659021.1 TRAP transporter small permease [Ramlibacter sp.]MCW5650321.1 TRAP transporter small permease [Ramlibacter sp.]
MVKLVYRTAEWLAYLGGLLLTAIAVMVVVSVSGRALISVGLGPVPGDFEMVEMATAVVVFFFLPWCYLKNGHAMVDIIYMHLPRWAQRFLTVFSDVLMLAIWVILTWRLGVSVGDKYNESETTFILQIPVWWAYAVSLFGAGVGCVTYLTKTLVELGVAREPAGWSAEPAGGHV